MTTAVERVVSVILDSFKYHKYLGMASVDLSRAFHSVYYNVLLSKLEFYGIKNKELDFFRSYLQGIMQMVSLGSEAWFFIEILAGVPLGSVLGPLLFATLSDQRQ